MKSKEKEVEELIKKAFKGIDDDLDKVIDKALKKNKELDELDDDLVMLSVEAKKKSCKVKFGVDDVDTMSIVAIGAIRRILDELPKSKRSSVISTILFRERYGL